jgi:hypothetical protein
MSRRVVSQKLADVSEVITVSTIRGRLHGATSLKTVILTLAAVRT